MELNIIFVNGDKISTEEHDEHVIAHYSSNDKIDTVLHFDFENGVCDLKYYVNGQYTEGADRTGLPITKTPQYYNYTRRYEKHNNNNCQSATDANTDHICDNCGLSVVTKPILNYIWQYYENNRSIKANHKVIIFEGNIYE